MGDSVDVLILDFSQAFDSVVSHSKLLFQLRRLGLHLKILEWVQDFLTARLQYVAIDDCQSTSRKVTSGVPQGSVLGPLLFFIYVNDLPAQIQSYCRLFADDVILYNTSQKRPEIEQDLNHLKIWDKNWQISFNVDKCILLLIGSKALASHLGYS